jgi:hypothetical protein
MRFLKRHKFQIQDPFRAPGAGNQNDEGGAEPEKGNLIEPGAAQGKRHREE